MERLTQKTAKESIPHLCTWSTKDTTTIYSIIKRTIFKDPETKEKFLKQKYKMYGIYLK